MSSNYLKNTRKKKQKER